MANLILLEEYEPLETYELNEGVGLDKKFYLRGIFGRANYANKNKRVYPREIMEESLKTIQPLIESNAFVGELEHPCLGVSGFSILTKNGWKDFLDCKVGDEVVTFNEDNVIEYQPIETIINEPFKGKIYNFKGRNIDVPFTGNHRLYLKDQNDKREIVTAKEIFNDRKKYNHHKIIKIEPWSSETSDSFIINETFLEITEEDFDDRIYCITVPNGNFYMKYKGKAYLTGNSTPKVNVERISHVITKLALAPDNAIIGEIRALDTDPGKHLKMLLKEGIRLGVSTRGIGSLKPHNGIYGQGLQEVAPGYSFKAIDVVFEPSAESYPDAVMEGTDHRIMLGGTRQFSEVWNRLFSGIK